MLCGERGRRVLCSRGGGAGKSRLAGLLIAMDQVSEHAPLDCRKCPSFCCRMVGDVEVSRQYIRRLAKFFALTGRQDADRKYVRANRKGEMCIKQDLNPGHV